ncbi:MAG: penicillin-binding transpeptidase domain-containing protein, partial [Verrucomicrobiota bacterium]
PETQLDGPASLKIGNRYFKNWNRRGEGKMDVAGAIMRSCNTWFYRAAMETGSQPLSDMAHQLGFGRTTGLPLAAVPSGFVPTEESSRERSGHGLTHGYLANMSIGQGDVSASPLQVARMMAAVGNGGRIPALRLVRQIQSSSTNEIVRVYPEGAARPLGLEASSLEAVVKGMVAVVHSRYGTGGRAAIYHGQMAGKTGTGQWGNPAEKKYVAWFAGFVPVDDPRYAFAALYEGRPGEYLSGGKRAAPMVRSFFNSHYANEVAGR